MDEILIALQPAMWRAIKKGTITIILQQTKPEKMFYPFRVIVYEHETGVVGAFDCHQIIQTIRPAQFAGVGNSCLSEEALNAFAGKPVCGWYVKAGSVVEYEIPFPLEMATGLKHPPESWEYIHREEST